MNKRILIIVFVIIAVISASFLYLSGTSDTTPSQSTKTTDTADSRASSPTNDNTQTVTSLGSYKDYDASTVSSTKGVRLLFFHAPWCPQCRALESDIKKQGVPEGVTIFKVDYDSNQSLRQKYGVTLQTTVVRVDDSENAIKKYVAYDDPTLEALKENLLP